jgi:TadE-like protein
MIRERRGQSAVWGVLALLVLIAVVSGLVDIYRLYAARNWAYSVAQEAAMAGASHGRDWSSLVSSGAMQLDAGIAQSEAQQIVQKEMAARGVTGYLVDIRVLPEATGGSLAGFPPRPVRLGNGMGDWSSDEPAVGVYLEVPVNWLMLDRLVTSLKSVHVFAAAGVAQ